MDGDLVNRLVLLCQMRNLVFRLQRMESKVTILCRVSNRSAAEVVCIIANDVPEVSCGGCLEVNG